MKIAIELRQIQKGASGGIVLFLKGLLETLFRLDSKNEYIIFCTEENKSLLNPASNVHVQVLSSAVFYKELDDYLIENKVDILFRSFPDVDPLFFPVAKQLVLIPDLQHEIYPEFFSKEILDRRRMAFNKALSDAGAICTLSHAAKQSLLSHSWTECRDIFITSPALQTCYEQENPINQEENQLLPLTRYFLFPANIWPHKNHRRLLRSFQLFLEQTNQPIELILTGHPEGWEALSAEFPNLSVRHLGFVSPALMHALMQRAEALLFFSLFEGFGMPLLEAFQAGTPVLCSNTTSLPEIGGDAVLMCDPTDVEAMTELMQRITTDMALRKRLIVQGQQRLSHYKWAIAAQHLLAGFERLKQNEYIVSGVYPDGWVDRGFSILFGADSQERILEIRFFLPFWTKLRIQRLVLQLHSNGKVNIKKYFLIFNCSLVVKIKLPTNRGYIDGIFKHVFQMSQAGSADDTRFLSGFCKSIKVMEERGRVVELLPYRG